MYNPPVNKKNVLRHSKLSCTSWSYFHQRKKINLVKTLLQKDFYWLEFSSYLSKEWNKNFWTFVPRTFSLFLLSKITEYKNYTCKMESHITSMCAWLKLLTYFSHAKFKWKLIWIDNSSRFWHHSIL